MIKTKLFGVEAGVDFTFFAILAMFLTLDTTGFAIISLLVCVVHEAGHLLAMLIVKQKPASITFKGGGIVIGSRHEQCLLVLIAGSFVNIVLFFALYFALPKNDIYPVMFAVLNLVIGVFNLFPVGCLDGKKLLALFVPEKPLKVIEAVVLCLVFVVIAAALLVEEFRGGVNFTLAAAMIYVVCIDFFSNV